MLRAALPLHSASLDLSIMQHPNHPANQFPHSEEALKNIETLNSRLSGIIPIWAFVPNKSTAYLYPDKQFWSEAERRFGAPNLLRMTQQAIDEKTVDLYPANNTHFSTVGYLLMGEEILKTIQKARHIGSLR